MKNLYRLLLLVFIMPHHSGAVITILDQVKAKQAVDGTLRQRRIVVSRAPDGTEQPQAVLVFADDEYYMDEFEKGIRDRYLCLASWMVGAGFVALAWGLFGSLLVPGD